MYSYSALILERFTLDANIKTKQIISGFTKVYSDVHNFTFAGITNSIVFPTAEYAGE